MKHEKTRKNNQTTYQSSVPKTTCSLCRKTNPFDFRKNNKIITITKKQWHTYGPWNSSGWHRCGHRFDVSDLSIIHREAMTKPLMIRWIFMTDLSWFFHSHSFQAKMVDNQHIRDVGHIEKLISFCEGFLVLAWEKTIQKTTWKHLVSLLAQHIHPPSEFSKRTRKSHGIATSGGKGDALFVLAKSTRLPSIFRGLKPLGACSRI